MAYTIKKQVTIHRSPFNSSFARIRTNEQYIGQGKHKIGSAINPVNYILSKKESLNLIMGEILGVAPTSSDWNKEVYKYFHGITRPIDVAGEDLDIGMSFNINDSSRAKYISELSAKVGKKFNTDEDLGDFVFGKSSFGKPNVDVYDMPLYGTPINNSDFILYMYIQKYRRVANSEEEASKSKNIFFFIVDEEAIRAASVNEYQNNLDAMTALYRIIQEEHKVAQRIICMNPSYIPKQRNLLEMGKQLKDYVETNPSKFLKVNSDKRLADKYIIYRSIQLGMLSFLDKNTEAVYDRNNKRVGDNVDKAIDYFKLDNNLSEYNRLINSVINEDKQMAVNPLNLSQKKLAEDNS